MLQFVETLHQLAEYSLRLAPGLALVVVTVVLLGRAGPALRIGVLILGFVLIRDLMTPLGFWAFGRTDTGLPWLRFVHDGVLLVIFGLTGVALVGIVIRTQKDLTAYITWGRLNGRSLLTAAVGAAAIALPLLGVMQLIPIDERGGAVPAAVLLPLLILALGGNFMEEVLFRGYLQGYLETTGPGAVRIVVLSGLFFATGHVFLAATVTDLGWPVLVFTLAEGLVCAWVKHRSGVLAATLTHGLIIFVIASGL